MNNPQAFLKYLKTLNIQSHIQPHFSDLASKAKVALQKTPQLLPRKSGEAHKPPHHYRPTLYLSHPFFQVLYNISEPRKSLTYERERLFFEDGGHVCLDWASSLRLRNK
jgi:predicted alpha/beta-fold hydrolase